MTERPDVLPAVLAELDRLGGLSGVRLDRVTAGESAVLVELVGEDADAKRLAGLAHNPAGTTSSVTSCDLEALLASVRRSPVEASVAPLDRAAAVAAVNALSSLYLEWRPGDPMALLASTVETIVTVGLFRPAFRKFADVEVRVIEREPIGPMEATGDVTVRPFRPSDTAIAMSGADVVFVTGSTVVYGGLERYLAAAPPSATLVVVGATASFLPEPLFDRGVDVVAGAEITAPDRVRRAVEEGGCGTDLHDRGVRKVYIVSEPPANIQLS